VTCARKHADVRAAERAQEHIRQRLPLPVAAVGVDMQDDRPRRARLVVVVPDDQHGLQAADVDVVDVAVLDEPGKRAITDAVRRTPARNAVAHPARTDRVAVAGLDVRAADRVAHSPDLDE
jgi:hypothetical protein